MLVWDVVYAGLAILVNSVMFSWIYDLERNACKCSRSWKRTVLKLTIPVSLALAVAAAITPATSRWKVVAYTTYDLLSAVVLLLVLSYVIDLRRASCECARGWRETFSFLWPIVVITLWAVNTLFVLALMVYLAAHPQPRLAA